MIKLDAAGPSRMKVYIGSGGANLHVDVLLEQLQYHL